MRRKILRRCKLPRLIIHVWCNEFSEFIIRPIGGSPINNANCYLDSTGVDTIERSDNVHGSPRNIASKRLRISSMRRRFRRRIIDENRASWEMGELFRLNEKIRIYKVNSSTPRNEHETDNLRASFMFWHSAKRQRTLIQSNVSRRTIEIMTPRCDRGSSIISAKIKHFLARLRHPLRKDLETKLKPAYDSSPSVSSIVLRRRENWKIIRFIFSRYISRRNRNFSACHRWQNLWRELLPELSLIYRDTI